MKEPPEWLETEISGSNLKDRRLNNRFQDLLEQLWSGLGGTIPLACQDWANTKAAYRFLSNDGVTEDLLLAGHFQSTRKRVDALPAEMILMLQDTTEFSFHRVNSDAVGFTGIVPCNKDIFGKPMQRKQCGILMHSSLAITAGGLPLGLTAIKFWSRKEFKGTNELKRHINPTRIPIEEKESWRWLQNMKQSSALLGQASRCVHIGDRESDIYELFCMAKELNTHFLVRTCVDRLIEDGKHTIAHRMETAKIQGMHLIEFQDAEGSKHQAVLKIKYQRIQLLPPVGKQKKYPALELTVIHAEEAETPANREKIVWKLLTDLPVTTMSEAIEKLRWYALRWRIETFHKILKSGCKAESSKLRTAQRITNLIAMFCILSWRIFWMTMINRSSPNASPGLVFTAEEIKLLDQLIKTRVTESENLASYLIKIARLGGYLARKSDPPPGFLVIWRGFLKLADILQGYLLGKKTCG